MRKKQSSKRAKTGVMQMSHSVASLFRGTWRDIKSQPGYIIHMLYTSVTPVDIMIKNEIMSDEGSKGKGIQSAYE